MTLIVSFRVYHQKVLIAGFGIVSLMVQMLCVTTSILNEYEEILNLLTNEETAKYIIDAIVSSPYTRFINVYFDFNLIQKDPDDNKFVDCAITAGARYIVTEDHHYDVLKWKDFPGLDIIGLDDFFAHLKNNPNP